MKFLTFANWRNREKSFFFRAARFSRFNICNVFTGALENAVYKLEKING